MSETPDERRANDVAAGDALRGALDAYDREERLYATRYAVEHGELPPGYRKCEECGELVLPGEYHHHEKKPAHDPEAESRHVSHLHCTYGPSHIDNVHYE